MQGWSHVFTTIASIYRCIRASDADEISGIIKLGTSQGWIVQLCHFHLISRLQNAEAEEIADWMADPCAKRFTNMSAKLSSCPMAPDCKRCSKNSGIWFARRQACVSCA